MHRLRGRLRSRNSWSALLAVLLGALAGASAFAPSPSFAGGSAVAGHGADARTAAKPASVRPDTGNPAQSLGGLDDIGAALAARAIEAETWSAQSTALIPAAFGLPVSVTRTRDGRTRAPPRA